MALKSLLYVPLLARFALSAPLEERDTVDKGITNWQCAHYEWGARWVPTETPVGDHLTFLDCARLLCGDFMDLIAADIDGTLSKKLEISTATSKYVREMGGTKKVGFSDGTEGHLTRESFQIGYETVGAVEIRGNLHANSDMGTKRTWLARRST